MYPTTKIAHSSVSWGSEELEKLPHRGYTTASLKKKAAKKSIYDGTAKNTANSFEFLGIVVGYNNKEKRIYLQTKNPLQEKAEIEILTPQKNITLIVENLKNAKGDSILYSDSNRIVSFDYQNELQAGLILRCCRKKIIQKFKQQVA